MAAWDGRDLSGRRVAVVGLGKSGQAVVRFLSARGALVIGCDDREAAQLGPAASSLAELSGVSLRLGGLSADVLTGVDLIVLSPGVPPSREPIAKARAAGVSITGEIELASHFIDAPIVGITGTNGKSTVTALCGAIAEATGRPSFCGGNLGTPLIDAVGGAATREGGIVVCELSSYQLETAESLHCAAATILNLTPDHLDRYGDMTAYGDAKGRIFRHHRSDETRVIPADDALVAGVYGRATTAIPDGAPAYFFSTRGPVPTQVIGGRELRIGGWVEGAELVLSGVAGGLRALLDGGPLATERYPIAELQIVGRHNLGNALSAFLLMRASGLATYEQVRSAAARFVALPHRMQLVGEVAGVAYYDDSKGTNVDAVVAGIDGFPRPLALIAGGRDKGGSYAPLREALSRTPTRGLVLIGEAAPLIAAAFAGAAFPILHADSMPEAVRLASRLCGRGDAVVLSPACSSFDMFRDYAHRAQVFVEAVQGLASGGAS